MAPSALAGVEHEPSRAGGRESGRRLSRAATQGPWPVEKVEGVSRTSSLGWLHVTVIPPCCRVALIQVLGVPDFVNEAVCNGGERAFQAALW